MNPLLTSRLAARGGTRSAELVLDADTAGQAADRVVRDAWRRLLAAARPGPAHFAVTRQRAAEILATMAHELWAVLHRELEQILRRAHAAAADAMMQTLPRAYLRAAGAARLRGRIPEAVLRESRESELPEAGALELGAVYPELPFTQNVRDRRRAVVLVDVARLDAAWSRDRGYYIPPGGGGAEIAGRRVDFRHFLASGRAIEPPRIVIDEDGTVSFLDGRHRFSVLRDLGVRTIPVIVERRSARRAQALLGPGDAAAPAADLAAPLRVPHTLGRDEEYELFRSLLFPAPTHEEARAVLGRLLPAEAWLGHVGDESARPPVDLANLVAGITSAGGTPADVARALKPYFDGSAARAARTARTLGAYLGTERNLATAEALGDLVIGYQVHDAGGPTARPAHALRSGTIYWKHPKPGQWGLDVMPHPPIDTQRGPHDDLLAPRGVCYHCRCWLTPVLAALPAMATPAFTDHADRLIPDPAHFADWWERAGEPHKAAVAGVRRLRAAREVLGREPTWAELVDPHTGRLLSAEELRREGMDDRLIRAAKVRIVIARNRDAVRQTAAFGTA